MSSHLLNSITPCKKTPILVYHKLNNITKKKDRFRLSVSIKSFEKQMEYISRNKNCLNLEDYVTCIKNGQKPPDNSVVITFDDGYKDNYLCAFPVLKKYNLRAIFFVTTNFVGLTNKWDEHSGEIRSDLMSWDDLNIMSRHGMSFGSHSCTHSRLPACSDEQLKQELMESKTKLEEKLNKRIELFSYPWGDSDLRTTQIAKTVGYAAACSDRKAETEDFFLYNLNRIHIYPSDSLTLFKIKVSGWFDWIENLLTFFKIRGVIRRLNDFQNFTKKLVYLTN